MTAMAAAAQARRDQDERNAINALAAARLLRVEKRVQRIIDQLGDLPMRARVDAAALVKALEDALKAPAGP